MRSVFQAFERGDVQPLLDAMDEDVVWKSAATRKGFFPFGGTYTFRDGVTVALRDIAKRYAFRRFAPKEIVSQEDIVWGLFDVELEHIIETMPPRSELVRVEMAIRWRMRENRIVEHQAFFDTAALLIPPVQN